MAKTKTPFLSLGASGSIGGVVTAQKRGTSTLLRAKPIPAYRYTLPQAYQRWLYEDYAYLWTQQTTAVKQSYATQGSRFHLTGFQQWMSYHLAHLPDIALMLHMDEKAGAIVYDSSKNQRNFTLYGASPITGIIDGSLRFDGINDRLTRNPYLVTAPFTILLWWKRLGNSGGSYSSGFHMLLNFINGNINNSLLVSKAGTIFGVQIRVAGVSKSRTLTIPLPNEPHLLGAIWTGDQLYILVDTTFSSPTAAAGILISGTTALTIGWRDATQHIANGMIDHLVHYTRVLNPTEILRHSLRRYPP